MKIPLDAPIWGRLYGAYGVEPVALVLSQLRVSWDEALAKDLFWEKLYHQETLYPVTYAALPWLLEIGSAQTGTPKSLVFFSSEILYCADFKFGRDTLYNGLSLDLAAHHEPFYKSEFWIRAEDVPILGSLQDWFTANRGAIADCVLEFAKTVPTQHAGPLLRGKAAVMGARRLADVVGATDFENFIFACPECGFEAVATVEDGRVRFRRSMGIVSSFLIPPPNPAIPKEERKTAREIAALLGDHHPLVQDLLLAFAEGHCCADTARS